MAPAGIHDLRSPRSPDGPSSPGSPLRQESPDQPEPRSWPRYGPVENARRLPEEGRSWHYARMAGGAVALVACSVGAVCFLMHYSVSSRPASHASTLRGSHGFSEVPSVINVTAEDARLAWPHAMSGKKESKKATKQRIKEMRTTDNIFGVLSNELAEEATEALWEVVSDTLIVWDDKDLPFPKQLGERSKCDILLGWQVDDWVRLESGGFVRTQDSGQTLLRDFTVSYQSIMNGTCGDIGMYPITDSNMCELAAAELGSGRTSVQLATGTSLPAGCYVSAGSELWLVPHTDAGRTGGHLPAMRETTCSSHAPCHMTTATTTLTSSSVTETTRTDTITITSTSTASVLKTTLFCFSVIRVGDGSTEPALLQEQYQNGASIFGCTEYTVLSNGGSVWIGGEETAVIPAPTVKLGKIGDEGVTTSSWVNTLIFMEAWKMIGRDGRYWNQDWTVKVDPDAVFFPVRLAVKLHPYTDYSQAGYFVNNCGAFVDRGWSEFYGSLEVFSKEAVHKYLSDDNDKLCKSKLDWKGWGEDLYISQCLAMLKVENIDMFDLLGDKRCVPAECTDTTKVAFHDFKAVDTWVKCWKESGGIKQPAQVVSMAS